MDISKRSECSALSDANLCRKLVDDFTESKNEKMQVFLRIRPFKVDELQNEVNRHCLTIEGRQTVLIRPPFDGNSSKNVRESARIHQRFSFSRVFGPDFEQKDFFDGAVLPTIKASLKGETCLIFAYGATNSGKTYTIQGTSLQPGIVPRALAYIFKNTRLSCEDENMSSVFFHDGTLHTMHEYAEPHQSRATDAQSAKEISGNEEEYLDIGRDSDEVKELFSDSIQEECHEVVSFWVSFAEIYNENIYDLLQPLKARQKRRNLNLAMDRTTDNTALGNHIKGLRYVRVSSVADALRILQVGRTNLHFASNKLNQQSSRSHCIFTLHMTRPGSGDKPNVNSLTFCDLAGLERVTKTLNTGSRLKEAGNINTSLLVLGRCIEALREKRVVPYRDSKLTRLFQGYFTENGKASMIVNVSQSSEMLNDTLHVLKFSASAQQIVSVDNLDRTRLWFGDQSVTTISGRITDLWPMAHQRWSEFSKGRVASQDSSIPEESEENSVIELSSQEGPADAQELIDIIWGLERKIQELNTDRQTFETEIRYEVCSEFEKLMRDMEERYKRNMQVAEEMNEELMERRLSSMRKDLVAQYEAEYEESDSNLLDETTGSKMGESPSVVNTQERVFLNSERQTLLEERANLIGDKESLANELEKLRQEMAALSKRNAFLEQETNAMVKESSVLQKENGDLLKVKVRLEKELSARTKEKEVVADEKNVFEREVAMLRKAYDSLLSVNKGNGDLEKAKSQLEKEVAVATRRIGALAAEMKEMEKRHDVYVGESDERVEALRKERELMEGNLVSVQSRCEKVESHCCNLEEENEVLKNQVSGLEGEVRVLRERVSSLESELHLMRADDFKEPKKANTRGRKRAPVETENVPPTKKSSADNIAPKRGRRTENVPPPPTKKSSADNIAPKRGRRTATATKAVARKEVNILSPLLAVGQAIRQSPTFKAMENMAGHVIKKFTGGSGASSPAMTRRTRRKLYSNKTEEEGVVEEMPQTETSSKRQTRGKKK